MSDKVTRPIQTPVRAAMSTLGVVLLIALVAAETYVIVQHPQVFSTPFLVP